MYVAEEQPEVASYINSGRKMSVSEGNAILQEIDVSNESGILIPLSFAIQR